MENNFLIRKARPDDQDRLVELWITGLKSHMIGPNATPEFTQVIQRYLDAKCKPDGDMYNIQKYYLNDDPRKTFIVAEETSTGKIAGCVAAIPSTELNGEEYLELVRMSVDSSFRGTGVGPLLVKAFEDWAICVGYRKVTLTAWDCNIPAVKFYKKFGYKEIENFVSTLPPSAYYIFPEEESKVGLVYYEKGLLQ